MSYFAPSFAVSSKSSWKTEGATPQMIVKRSGQLAMVQSKSSKVLGKDSLKHETPNQKSTQGRTTLSQIPVVKSSISKQSALCHKFLRRVMWSNGAAIWRRCVHDWILRAVFIFPAKHATYDFNYIRLRADVHS